MGKHFVNNINKSQLIFLIPIDDYFQNRKYKYEKRNDSDSDSNNISLLGEEDGEIHSSNSLKKIQFTEQVLLNNWKTMVFYFKKYKYNIYKKSS